MIVNTECVKGVVKYLYDTEKKHFEETWGAHAKPYNHQDHVFYALVVLKQDIDSHEEVQSV